MTTFTFINKLQRNHLTLRICFLKCHCLCVARVLCSREWC